MQILNTNHYQRGYQDGLIAAMAGKNKLYKTVNDLGWWLRIDAEETIQETYEKGYDDGYTDGLRKRNNIFESQNQQSNQETITEQSNKQVPKMNNENLSYEQQIVLLQELWSFLDGFAGSLDMTLQTYTDKIGHMYNGGLSVNMMQKLITDCASIKESIDTITLHIRYEDKKTIDDSIALLQELINTQK